MELERLLEEVRVGRTSLELAEEEERPSVLRRPRRSGGEYCLRRCTFGNSRVLRRRQAAVEEEGEEVVGLVAGRKRRREGVGFQLQRVDPRWIVGLERRRREG